mgnify:CR=1 FL=1
MTDVRFLGMSGVTTKEARRELLEVSSKTTTANGVGITPFKTLLDLTQLVSYDQQKPRIGFGSNIATQRKPILGKIRPKKI